MEIIHKIVYMNTEPTKGRKGMENIGEKKLKKPKKKRNKKGNINSNRVRCSVFGVQTRINTYYISYNNRWLMVD